MIARSEHAARFGFREAFGFAMFAVGLFLVVAFVSHNPHDYEYRHIDASTYRNLAGPIGIVVSHVVLALIYFGLFMPIALVFRVIGRDPLHRRFEPEAQSYWVERGGAPAAKRYFQQF